MRKQKGDGGAVSSDTGSKMKEVQKVGVKEEGAPGVSVQQKPKEVKSSPRFERKKLEKIFHMYMEEGEENPDTQVIGPDGIERFCADLDISPEDVSVLVLAYELNCQEMGYFASKEFLEGFEKLGLDSMEGIKEHVTKLRGQLNDPATFKAVYRFAFFYSKETEQKVMELEMAGGMLSLLLVEKYPITKSFVEFLKVQEVYKAMNLDQWMSLLEFCKAVGNDFSNYDENGAWPCIIDEWVEWSKKTENPEEEA